MAEELAGIDDRAISVVPYGAAGLQDIGLSLDSRPEGGASTLPTDQAPTLALRRAFSMFPTGVVAMCALDEDGPVGLTVNSFASVSLSPPLVSVCLGRQSFTWSRLARLPRIGLSVLGAAQEALSRQLSARHGDRFAGVDFAVSPGGAVLIHGGPLWLECSIRDRLDGGDHEIVLLDVVETSSFPDIRPLVFHQSQYRALA